MAALVRWEPARELNSLQGEVNRLFDTFFGDSGGGAAPRRWIPAMDLIETEAEFVLTADLPGLDGDDVAIEVKDGVLTVSGERKLEHKSASEGYYRVERGFGRFSRSLTLPEGVDAEKVAARFDKGELTIRIPKPEERQPHRVAIGGAGSTVNGTGSES